MAVLEVSLRMIVRRTRVRRSGGAFLLAGVLSLVAVAPLAASVGQRPEEPGIERGDEVEPARNVLDDRLVDAAWIRNADRPMLVTVAELAADGSGGVPVELAVLGDDRGTWQHESTTRLDLPSGAGRPWLLRLDDDRFLLLSVSIDGSQTFVAPLRIDEEAVRVGAPRTIPGAADDAGIADVDGDGRPELVVASATTFRHGPACQSSRVTVLDAVGFRPRSTVVLEGIRLAAGALGRFGRSSGDDLVATGYDDCPAGSDRPSALELVVVDLAAGQIRPTVALSPDPGPPWSGGLAAGDFDGDGRAELIVRYRSGLVMFDPAHDWQRVPLASGDVVPVSASPAGGSTPVALLSADRLVVGTITRRAGRLTFTASDELAASAIGEERWTRALDGVRAATAREDVGVGASITLDAGRCPEFVLPTAIAWCAGDGASGEKLRGGPAWFATRPIGTVGDGPAARLLVAETVEWSPEVGLRDPSPLAVQEASGATWRHGPSTSFALAEVSPADLGYFGSFPVPAPTIERTSSGTPPAVHASGTTGMRFLARVRGVASGAPAPGARLAVARFLHDPDADGQTSAIRLEVPAGHDSGIDYAYASIPLAAAPPASATSADGGWMVTYVALNEWGEASDPIADLVVRDTTPPNLSVDLPVVNAPWPFGATLRGIAEPGAQVSLDGGAATDANRRGRFELGTQLAPWPETLVFRALDGSGNATIRRFTLVAGIDLGRLPLAWIAAAVVLAWVVLSSLRSPRRRAREAVPAASRSAIGAGRLPRRRVPVRRDIPWFANRDAEPQPEIEEL